LIKAHPENRGSDITFTADDPEPQLKVNPAEVLQMLINLGVNALHASNGKGTLQLSAARVASTPANLAFRSDALDDQKPYVRISVIDNGSGIPPENVSKIFQPYFTSKKEGTGLGLAIVCELISRYEGAIDVHSTVGQGTTFSLYLPLAA